MRCYAGLCSILNPRSPSPACAMGSPLKGEDVVEEGLQRLRLLELEPGLGGLGLFCTASHVDHRCIYVAKRDRRWLLQKLQMNFVEGLD